MMVANTETALFPKAGSKLIREFISMNKLSKCYQNPHLLVKGKIMGPDKMRLQCLCRSYGYFDQTENFKDHIKNRSI